MEGKMQEFENCNVVPKDFTGKYKDLSDGSICYVVSQ